MSLVLRRIIKEEIRKKINEGSVSEMHRTMSGEMVPFGCQECVFDLRDRIADATYERDICPGRTDSREHYNGVLKVLRRKLRRADKINSEVMG